MLGDVVSAREEQVKRCGGMRWSRTVNALKDIAWYATTEVACRPEAGGSRRLPAPEGAREAPARGRARVPSRVGASAPVHGEGAGEGGAVDLVRSATQRSC